MTDHTWCANKIAFDEVIESHLQFTPKKPHTLPERFAIESKINIINTTLAIPTVTVQCYEM